MKRKTKAFVAFCLTGFLTLSFLIPAGAAGGSRAASASWGGRWRYVMVYSCDRRVAGVQKLCNNTFGTIDGFTWVWNGSAARDGKLAFTSQIVATESHPGKKHICSPKVYMNAVYDGSCSFEDDGTGFIKEGLTHLPEFWFNDEIETFHLYPSDSTKYDPSGAKNYPVDVGIQAVPGIYDTTANLRILGLIKANEKAPAGIFLEITVEHARR